MTSTPAFLMRSLMFVPGHNEKLHQSAARCDADVILLDMEDSVLPLANKQVARDLAEKNVKAGLYRDRVVFVRINDRESGEFLRDIVQLAIEGVTGFLFSKANTAQDIIFFDRLLEAVEYERGFPVGKFKIIPILESASSIVNADAIAKASPRNVAIGFGSEDFVSDLQGVRDFEEAQSLFVPRAWVAMVARTNRLIPIDAPYIKIHDLEGLSRHLEVGRRLGYAGMWCLHPKQNAPANECYAPSQEEIEEAREIMRLDQEAQRLGKGVAIINGSFIGPPLVVKAKYTLARAELVEAHRK